MQRTARKSVKTIEYIFMWLYELVKPPFIHYISRNLNCMMTPLPSICKGRGAQNQTQLLLSCRISVS